ncbi:MAG TPA: bifunctional diguanylate cyclase/phosphodiesterase [Acidimicrobiales bacterium]
MDGEELDERVNVATRRVYVLAAAVATLAAGLTAGPVRELGPFADLRLPWLAFVVAFALSEIFLIHFEHRREAVSLSLSTIPLVVGLYAVDPVLLVAARVLGSAIALVFHRRQVALKLAVNLSHMGLEVAAAILVFRALAPDGGFGVASWPAALAGAVVGDILQSAVLTAAISLYQGRREGGLALSMAVGSAARLIDTSVALVIVSVLRSEPAAVVLLAVACAVLLWSYRAHVSLRVQHRQLAKLYEFTGRMSNAMLGERVVESLLTEAKELLHADVAWVHLDVGTGHRRIVLDTDGQLVTEEQPGDDATALHDRVQHAGKAVILERVDEPALASLGAQQVLATPLRAAGAALGTLVVSNRRGEVRSFATDDLPMFATLANHAGVALANNELLERLRHEASVNEHKSLHDALTDLPNRSLFSLRVEAALARGSAAAVLLLDLDRFKEVNDTLGHQHGDDLLQQVAARLRACLRHGDTIARLGGDEFAVLLPDVPGPEAAVGVARTLVDAVDQPFSLADVTVDISASIGVAIAPHDGRDGTVLLQRADVAMYLAKGNQSGVELYERARDPHTPERLALVGELRNAVADDELDVYYQPQVDLATGDVVGVEALVRWNHPRRGWLSPEEFVPVAEQTGLIHALTRFVLGRALQDCAVLRAEGGPGRVSVNLSAKNLVDASLVDDVVASLRAAGVPATALCLELTETTIMREPRRNVVALRRLADLGVTVAIDDFGTGHSSLAYLKQLPVGEIKIDKSFVLGMSSNTNDDAIVCSIAQLAANLAIPVVAEGVESDRIARRLEQFGCGIGQGFGFSRPVPLDELRRWVAARRGSIDLSRTA